MTDALPPFARAALLLDLDGTLLDFAATPDSVVVPPDLPGTLARLRGELDGALAVITGRPVEQIERLLPGAVPVISGEHGGAFGAARLARMAVTGETPDAICHRPARSRSLTPPSDLVEAYTERLQAYRALYPALSAWPR